MSNKLLFADDDAKVLLNCFGDVLKAVGPFDIELAETPEAALKAMSGSDFKHVLLDVSFTPGKKEGIDLISKFKKINPNASIIMLTSYEDTDTISKCMSLGVSDYLVKKDFEDLRLVKEKLAAIFSRTTKENSLEIEAQKLAHKVGASFRSKSMKDLYSKIYTIKNETRMHVLVTGETGVGKELVAKSLVSDDKAPFFPINCSCLGKELLEGELFGHEKGAFTGADKQKIGLFEKANGGVVFLDEVATLSLEHQAKLLRVLQSGEFFRVGGTTLFKTTARVVAATNENLEQMVKEGRFREDLLQRLGRFKLHIPPLRERKEDIPLIIRSIIEKSSKPGIQIDHTVMKLLEASLWPRNVRQLEDTVLSAILMANGATITLGDLPKSFFSVEISPEKEKPLATQNWVSDLVNLSIDAATQRFGAAYMIEKIKKLSAPVTLDSLAASVGLSKSSVQRRLKDYGIDLATIKAEVNLANKHDSIKEAKEEQVIP